MDGPEQESRALHAAAPAEQMPAETARACLQRTQALVRGTKRLLERVLNTLGLQALGPAWALAKGVYHSQQVFLNNLFTLPLYELQQAKTQVERHIASVEAAEQSLQSLIATLEKPSQTADVSQEPTRERTSICIDTVHSSPEPSESADSGDDSQLPIQMPTEIPEYSEAIVIPDTQPDYLILPDMQEQRQPQTDEQMEQQQLVNTTDSDSNIYFDAVDCNSQLKGMHFALQRIQPVLEVALESAEISKLRNTKAEVPTPEPGAIFTCPVCFDDEVTIDDAFVIGKCGHRLCRPCAIRTVDFNIKQLQAQVCPQCQGTPCQYCPITLWDRETAVSKTGADLLKQRSPACPALQHLMKQHAQRSSNRPGTGYSVHILDYPGVGPSRPANGAGPSQPRNIPQQAQAQHAGPSSLNAQRGNQHSNAINSNPELFGFGSEEELWQVWEANDLLMPIQGRDDAGASSPLGGRRKRGRRDAQAQANEHGGPLDEDDDQHQQFFEELPPEPLPQPSVKWCSMAQTDLLLLLQPEELQRAQVAARKAKRERRQAKARRAAAGEPQQGRASQLSDSGNSSGTPCVDVLAQEFQPASKRRQGNSGVIIIDSQIDEPIIQENHIMTSNNGDGSSGSDSEDDGNGEEEALPPTYEAYLRAEALRLAHQEKLFQLCPKCGEGVELQEGSTRLRCPTCRKDHCVACGVDWHEGSTCEKYQEWAKENAAADEEFKKLQEKGDVKPCPKCNTGITKISGCDHVVCTKCRSPFCFRCGKLKTGAQINNHGCDCMGGQPWPFADPRNPRPAAPPANPAAAPPPQLPPAVVVNVHQVNPRVAALPAALRAMQAGADLMAARMPAGFGLPGPGDLPERPGRLFGAFGAFAGGFGDQARHERDAHNARVPDIPRVNQAPGRRAQAAEGGQRVAVVAQPPRRRSRRIAGAEEGND